MNNSVLYHELTPSVIMQRIKDFPVGYLPLGTLEWHSWHLPLGTDAIEGYELFKKLAEKIGGLVFPPLFLGPDITLEKDGKTFYGMEVYGSYGTKVPYEVQQLPAGCYWVDNEVFHSVIEGVVRNAARVGIKVLVGTGHCPSSAFFASMADEMKKKYNVSLITPDMDNPNVLFVPDHAAKIETSNIMFLRPELVHMENLDGSYPFGIDGDDPQISSSAKLGEETVVAVMAHLEKLIAKALKELS